MSRDKSWTCFGGAIAGLLIGASGALAQTPPAAPEPAPADPFASAATAASGEPAAAPPPAEKPAPLDISSAIQNGKLIFEARPRYELVDQGGIAENAEALTLRTRIGWETAAWNKMKALVEVEDVRKIGAEDFNNNLNGKTKYPAVFDPDVTEINRAQISYTPASWLAFVVGRQRINLDDQRFIGGVAWRQDEQTFDAARVDATWGRISGTYIYVDHVNRIFGDEQDWDSQSHLANATYAVAEALKLQGFAYLLDFDRGGGGTTTAARNASSKTLGVRATGKTWLSLVGVGYSATYANQEEYGPVTTDFSLDYLAADVSGTFDIYTARIGYESLEGNGSRSFATPLATVHAFQGWSDAFDVNVFNQAPNGVEDLNVSLNIKPRKKFQYLYNMDVIVKYHDFTTERTSKDMGEELDAQFTGAITKNLSVLLKYADYTGNQKAGTDGFYADRSKFWFGLEYKL